MWVLEVHTHAVRVSLRGWGLQEKDLHSLDLRLQSVRLAAHTSRDATRVRDLCLTRCYRLHQGETTGLRDARKASVSAES